MAFLPLADPKEAGFDPQRLDRLHRLVEAGVERGLYPAATYQLLRGGKFIAGGAVGEAAPGRACTPGTVFDLASLSKPIATATCILILAERGELHLNEEVTRFLPGDAAPLAGINVRHLLTHTSGLPAWKQYHSLNLAPETIRGMIRFAARERPIGSRYVYSDLGFILLGEVIERITGQPLDQFAAGEVFSPLAMSSTTFRPPVDWYDRTAATRCPDRARVLIGEVHDRNCAALGGVAGHAGLFSTAGDVGRYAAMLLARGELDGTRLLSPLAVGQMAVNRLAPEIGGSSLGWFTPPNGMLPAGDFLPADSFGHTGFTGTSLVIAPSLELAVVLLTNRVYQESESGDFLAFRRRFHNAIAAAITRGSADLPTSLRR